VATAHRVGDDGRERRRDDGHDGEEAAHASGM
jgi:hypothetical protein